MCAFFSLHFTGRRSYGNFNPKIEVIILQVSRSLFAFFTLEKFHFLVLLSFLCIFV